MSYGGVEFDGDEVNKYGGRTPPPSSPNAVPPAAGGRTFYPGEARGMAGWLMRHRWAKSESSAQGILLAIVILNIVVTFIIVKFLL